ncbi:class I SAM-dependent DNA methyltransferase [Salisediminibacterium selenitireducens]|uniref:site-specific DNA-methyltransferase (adenine-specific) n=1 Tax=Bacillus selenitireducens (strain ATCC 700615 / DSM 15326 / MLS10) TaxID=439292 RepID=D6XYY1_BACIE|nr:DNA methyltransferase [Salisediminibacterium selenitireducens]ADH98289.1 putative type II restriction enzyme (methylase subunit) [[Bacillus] selenitireducens MLS10]
MVIIELEDKITEIVNKGDYHEFIYEILEIYGTPRATITRLKKGNLNMSKKNDEVHLKRKVWFKRVENENLFSVFIELERNINSQSTKPRFLIVTDFNTLLAKDIKTDEVLDIQFIDLPKYFDFFLAWKGIEKAEFERENPADVKAAERFARLYNVLSKDNSKIDLFLVRLLFCLFAEDTGIFRQLSFTNSIKTLTREDGKDLNDFLKDVFRIMDIDKKDRLNDLPEYLNKFPYVNGQLFSEPHQDLVFSEKSRKLIIEAGELLDWSQINPDIFGSMIQAVSTRDNRSHLGVHYTSVPNIMKVIKPLFLDNLYKAFNDAYDDDFKLEMLLTRINKIKFFDPACGSGNFLIIAYKEMRRIEINIIKRLKEIRGDYLYMPSITLDQLYGIEIDEFAYEVALLSLWIADHQMNEELNNEIDNAVRPTLPLNISGNIHRGNALHMNWKNVCPNDPEDEVYVFGNPPYLGHHRQSDTHKSDIRRIFQGVRGNGYLDYICGWFYLGSEFIQNSNTTLAFVSTNSICQGEQVAILWSELFLKRINIHFAYQSFKWSNSARNNAGVTVVIIGLTAYKTEQNKLFTSYGERQVKNINAYLIDGENVIVRDIKKQLYGLPPMLFGNKPSDGGGLIFEFEEYIQAIEKYPYLKKYFRKYIGSDEILKGSYRYCLWIEEDCYDEIKDNPIISDRMNMVKLNREKSKAKSTREWANKPYKFKQISPFHKQANIDLDSYTIVVPAVSSESRFYIPMDLVSNKDTILSNRVYGIYGADIWILGILLSRMHMTWVRAVAGRLETRYSYSSGVCYNAFPIPEISQKRINLIEELVLEILDAREEDGRSLGEIYYPSNMPNDLLLAHQKLDKVVDRAYKNRDFSGDEERLRLLIELYSKKVNLR